MGLYKNSIFAEGIPLTCFACHDSLDGRVNVYWHGSDSFRNDNCVIALHPDCAATLAIGLASDSVQARDRTSSRRLRAEREDAERLQFAND
jgi:hypothetical protein